MAVPLLTLPLWCRWSCCRNCSEDWPPLQIQSPLQLKYCMLKVTITVHLLVSSAPEHHRPRHTWHWPWACTDLDSSRRGASSKTSSRKVEHSVSEHSQRRSPDGFAISWHFPVALYQLATSTPSMVLCWWHWSLDPSLCQQSSYWQLTLKLYLNPPLTTTLTILIYFPDEESSHYKNGVAMAAISPVSCNSSQSTTTLWRSELRGYQSSTSIVLKLQSKSRLIPSPCLRSKW